MSARHAAGARNETRPAPARVQKGKSGARTGGTNGPIGTPGADRAHA